MWRYAGRHRLGYAVRRQRCYRARHRLGHNGDGGRHGDDPSDGQNVQYDGCGEHIRSRRGRDRRNLWCDRRCHLPVNRQWRGNCSVMVTSGTFTTETLTARRQRRAVVSTGSPR
jgi:hypothetical protein